MDSGNELRTAVPSSCFSYVFLRRSTIRKAIDQVKTMEESLFGLTSEFSPVVCVIIFLDFRLTLFLSRYESYTHRDTHIFISSWANHQDLRF